MRTWTFQILGGDTITVQPDQNPGLAHNGSMSIYHFVGTEEEMITLGETLEEHGCTVKVTGDVETPEQTAYHQQYLEANASLFPCLECTKCYWLDLHVDGYCGFDAWSDEARKTGLKWHERAPQDLAACPLGKGETVLG